MQRVLLLAVVGLILASSARAAELDGVSLPNQQRIGATELRLNGIALRTWSFLEVPVYVAGLYLVHPDSDPARILGSPETKLLDIRFLREVSRTEAQAAWREGFARNCTPPCELSPADVERFLAAVPAMHKGEQFSILFTAEGAQITAGGRLIGRIADAHFATVMLATFIGPNPPTPRLKRELLGARLQATR
jgi:hypothetical protein